MATWKGACRPPIAPARRGGSVGASTAVAPYARTYLRISLLGSPCVLLALAGAGYLRGLQNTKPTLWIALGANALNLVIEVVLVFGLDRGIAGSAWGTVIAQFVAMLARGETFYP